MVTCQQFIIYFNSAEDHIPAQVTLDTTDCNFYMSHLDSWSLKVWRICITNFTPDGQKKLPS